MRCRLCQKTGGRRARLIKLETGILRICSGRMIAKSEEEDKHKGKQRHDGEANTIDRPVDYYRQRGGRE